jgi:hypothetical protein
MLPPMRIAVRDMPTLIRQMIEDAVRERPDTHLVEVSPIEDPSPVIDAGADALITGLTWDELPAQYRQALRDRPDLRIVTVSVGTGASVMHSGRGVPRTLGDLSPSEIVGAIVAVEHAERSRS